MGALEDPPESQGALGSRPEPSSRIPASMEAPADWFEMFPASSRSDHTPTKIEITKQND
jgi:hypothetical protein